VGHVPHMAELKNAHNILLRNPEESDTLLYPDTDERIS